MLFAKQIGRTYRRKLFPRCDSTGTVFYFSAADFPGLIQEPYVFSSRQGKRLQGYFYHYDAPELDRVVVFDHGMGAGHRAYMKEIELLARHGYTVFAYDHTGCMESEGDSTVGFTQSLSDLDDCLKALKGDPVYGKRRFSVIGHSWGAYACLNIAALHPDVMHVVALSGFLSVDQVLRQNCTGWKRCWVKTLRGVEMQAHPELVPMNAAESLQKTGARVLVIHSEDDPIVKAGDHFAPLRKALEGRENVAFLEVTGKGHNPNYTEDAVRYKDEFFALLKKKGKSGELKSEEQKREFVRSVDWNRMTAQDMTVWERIFATLDDKR